jgi:hypothetical protein
MQGLLASDHAQPLHEIPDSSVLAAAGYNFSLLLR